MTQLLSLTCEKSKTWSRAITRSVGVSVIERTNLDNAEFIGVPHDRRQFCECCFKGTTPTAVLVVGGVVVYVLMFRLGLICVWQSFLGCDQAVRYRYYSVPSYSFSIVSNPSQTEGQHIHHLQYRRPELQQAFYLQDSIYKAVTDHRERQ